MVINHLDKLFVTSDASTIINELEVEHPAAKLLVLASKGQEQEIGDGTNFVRAQGFQACELASRHDWALSMLFCRWYPLLASCLAMQRACSQMACTPLRWLQATARPGPRCVQARLLPLLPKSPSSQNAMLLTCCRH